MSLGEGPVGRARSPEAWALAAAAAWLVAAAIAWAVLGERAGAAVAVLAALLPLGLIALAAAMTRAQASARDERQRLRAEIDGLRRELRALASERAPRGGAADRGPKGAAEEPRDRRRGDRREPERPVGRPVEHPVERLGGDRGEPLPAASARPPALAASDFVRALDFPEDADDVEGFAALRRALADPQAHRLVQASQDVLTLLSQNGIYMDDLAAEPAPPALWRRFAGGVRGAGAAGLAGVDEASALELASTRMARDTVFRDVAHHFLRQFDLGLQRFVVHASDEEIAALARTRTARAFMLIARAAGTFD